MPIKREGTLFESLPTITLDGVQYEHLSIQRGALSAIYKSSDTFLRIGKFEKIQKDLETHKQMEAQGFPVPKIISDGFYGEMQYFIEESLGVEHFGFIFKREVEENAKISDETFDTFIDISEKWAKAQLGVAKKSKDWKQFELGFHLDVICEEMPEEKERILSTYAEVKKALSVFPFVLTHGDFGPFNMYPKGVIDLETSFDGSAPYDIGSMVTHLEWFPESREYEYFQFYTFTHEQKQKYLDRMDALYAQHGLPKVSDYIFEVDFLKGIWFAVRLDNTPKLQKFRFDRLRKLLNSK